ncbi:hypothetical protein EB061_03865 [bacterium]|nr:hypothetical protein [bacterium]
MMRLWIAMGIGLFSGISAQAAKETLRVAPDRMSFLFESFDGAERMKCRHVLEREDNPYDWTVKCDSGKGHARKFTVHLAVSRYRHPSPPEVTYEVLYWVDGNGATSLYDFDTDGGLRTINSNQSVTGEEAGLRMVLRLP